MLVEETTSMTDDTSCFHTMMYGCLWSILGTYFVSYPHYGPCHWSTLKAVLFFGLLACSVGPYWHLFSKFFHQKSTLTLSVDFLLYKISIQQLFGNIVTFDQSWKLGFWYLNTIKLGQKLYTRVMFLAGVFHSMTQISKDKICQNSQLGKTWQFIVIMTVMYKVP